MDLTSFLLARLDEDEAAARAATPSTWPVEAYEFGNHVEYLGVPTVPPDPWDPAFGVKNKADAEHISRHNPLRVLAECAAKRRLIALVREHTDGDDHVLRYLALPFAGHPEHRAEWLP